MTAADIIAALQLARRLEAVQRDAQMTRHVHLSSESPTLALHADAIRNVKNGRRAGGQFSRGMLLSPTSPQ
jgi:hypothetical protein